MDIKNAFNRDIFSVLRENGETRIKILGYFYQTDHDVVEIAEYCWLDFTPAELKKGYEEHEDIIDLWESEAKMYVGDLTMEEAQEALDNYEVVGELSMFDVNDTTPEGVYIN